MKCSEIMELQNRIKHLKIIENAKEMKLSWAQNRLKLVSSAAEEMKLKLKSSLEISPKINKNKIYENEKSINKSASDLRKKSINFLDHQYDEQNTDILREEIEDIYNIQGKNEKLLLEEKTIYLGNSSKLDYQNTKCISSTNLLKKNIVERNIEIVNIEQHLQKLLRSKEDRIRELEFAMEQLHTNVAEVKLDLEMQRYREVQALEFVQKLTDKNVQLFNDYQKLQNKYAAIEYNQIPLTENFEQMNLKIENLTSEKLKHLEDNNKLSKFLAEQMFINDKLSNQIEELKGQIIILSKKYNFIMKEVFRKIHLNHSNAHGICSLK
ncbi:coiled-coil domain-containing protein 186-like isoform X2 [Phymastichus coffea]|nr:coiled-coil domain-containing protein 186-like isoform X2 [Phymastichus coffea]